MIPPFIPGETTVIDIKDSEGNVIGSMQTNDPSAYHPGIEKNPLAKDPTQVDTENT